MRKIIFFIFSLFLSHVAYSDYLNSYWRNLDISMEKMGYESFNSYPEKKLRYFKVNQVYFNLFQKQVLIVSKNPIHNSNYDFIDSKGFYWYSKNLSANEITKISNSIKELKNNPFTKLDLLYAISFKKSQAQECEPTSLTNKNKKSFSDLSEKAHSNGLINCISKFFESASNNLKDSFTLPSISEMFNLWDTISDLSLNFQSISTKAIQSGNQALSWMNDLSNEDKAMIMCAGFGLLSAEIIKGIMTGALGAVKVVASIVTLLSSFKILKEAFNVINSLKKLGSETFAEIKKDIDALIQNFLAGKISEEQLANSINGIKASCGI